MNKRTDNYWAQRSVKRLTKAEKASIPYLKQVQKTYNDSAKATVESVKAMYRAYYRNDKTFNMAALNMIAPQGDIKRLKDEMKRLGLSTSLPKQYRGRMTRLELLNAQMWAEAKKAYLKENVYSTDLYDKIFRESYYQTGFDMAKGLGENLAFSNLDKSTVEKVLETKFEGKDFSQRIWSNTDHLAESLKDIMAKAIATGQPLERTSMEVRERFAVGTSNANRLIRTETCYFENNAELAAYAEMGIEEFVFMATLDSRTSDVCQNMDGKRFKMSKAQIGENVPPLHPNCRSTIRAYLSEEFEPTTRIARDPQTGKNYDIKNMTYEQWKKTLDTRIEVATKKESIQDDSIKITFHKKDTHLDHFVTNFSDKYQKEVKDAYVSRIEELGNMFPSIRKEFNDNDATLSSNGRLRTTAARFESYTSGKPIGIAFGAQNKSVIEIEKQAEGQIVKKSWMPASKEHYKDYIATHEFGHAVENHIINRRKTSIFERRNEESQIRREILAIAREANKDFNLMDNLSRYGTKDSGEFFAESFANAFCGSPNELGQAMIKYLQKEGIYNV